MILLVFVKNSLVFFFGGPNFSFNHILKPKKRYPNIYSYSVSNYDILCPLQKIVFQIKKPKDISIE